MSSKKDTKDKNLKQIYAIILSIILFCIVYFLLPSSSDIANNIQNENIQSNTIIETNSSIGIDDIPEYSGQMVIVINNDVPYFSAEDITTENFEDYSELDEFKRAGVAYANICSYTMPEERNYKRKNII